MRTWRDVARYHLVVPWAILLLPWAILACSFLVNLVIFSRVPVADASPSHTGGVASIYVLFFVIGVSADGRSLPFALALGVSRRSYYAGTAALGGGAGGRRRARARRSAARLTLDELDERLTIALSARTITGLAALIADLPGRRSAPLTGPPGRTRAQPGTPTPSRWLVIQSQCPEARTALGD
jgi:Domain of unknown function (DUF1707)